MTNQTSLPSFRILIGALAIFVNIQSCPWGTVSAFSPSTGLTRARASSSSSSSATTTGPLNVSTSSRPSAAMVEEEEAMDIVTKAQEFAFSDDKILQGSSSLTDEEALLAESRYWLREMIRVQSGCATGTIAEKGVCENQLEAAEIVGLLRSRIERHEKRLAKRSQGSDSVVPWIATELSVGALLVVVAIFWTTLDLGQQHDDIPSLENYQDWMSVLKEKEYQLFGWGGK